MKADAEVAVVAEAATVVKVTAEAVEAASNQLFLLSHMGSLTGIHRLGCN